MRMFNEKMHVEGAIRTAVALLIMAVSYGPSHAARESADSNASAKRTSADVKKIIAEQKKQLEKDSKAFDEAKTYPYYSFYQVPGARGRKDTELRKVLTGSLPDEKPEDYNLRVVQFANRKGVDYIDVDPRMPLREWTFTNMGGVLPRYRTSSGKIKAHLVGFHCMGFTLDEGEFAGRYRIPKLLLRFPDGCVRVVEPGHISKEDQDFVAKEHLAALNEIKANRREEKPRIVPPNHMKQYGKNLKEPGERNGTLISETPFFYFISGSEHPEPGNAGHWTTWISATGDKKAGRWERLRRMELFDTMWLVFEYGGFFMPRIGDPQPRHKFGWHVGGPTRDGIGTKGGGGGWHIGNGEFGIGAHEWGHMTQFLNGSRHGGGETWADTLRDTALGGGGGFQLSVPGNHIFQGMNCYGPTQFYRVVGEDPSLGYLWYTRMPTYGPRESKTRQSSILAAFEMFKRLKLSDYADSKMVNKPVEEFGDLFGEYAARAATFDFQRELRPQIPPRQVLEQVDAEENLWRIPMHAAPLPYSFNVVRLVPEKGAESIEVDFSGMHDPQTYGDWRASLVAVAADGTRRYCNMWNKGKVKFPVKADDKSLYLVVAATPTAFTSEPTLQTAKRLPTYPWQVALDGATVGTATTPDPSSMVAHKNGGGLVAKSASVTDSAYVGPNAMVLGGAKVGENARIEGFAVVNGAVVEKNAKLWGSAVAGGRTVVKENSRFHAPVANNIPDIDIMSDNALPPRFPRGKRNEQGIWAVYAMMDADNVFLHDYYRAAPNHMHPMNLNLNGYVYGKPQAVVYDETAEERTAGLQFDGVSQYAQLHPAAVDLLEATIVAKLIVEPNIAGTIFDLGTDKDNCMKLTVAKDSTLRLKAVVDGQTAFDLVGSKKMVRSKPVQLRAEADGQAVALWMDKDKIAEAKSAFRCTDLFGPDVIRNNTIVADRDGENKLKCIFDSLVIYAKVYNEVDGEGVVSFDKLTPPPLEAPPVVKDNILALLTKRKDPARTAPLMEAARSIIDFYASGFGRAKPGANGDIGMAPPNFLKDNLVGRRWDELLRRDPDYVKWVDEILPKNAGNVDMKREFEGKIRPKAMSGRNRDQIRALNGLSMALWRRHWSCDYDRYIKSEYLPKKIVSILGSAGDENLDSITKNNGLTKATDWMVTSSDVTVSKPVKHIGKDKYIDVWSVEGIISGEYDKLTPELKQWYLHTHGPIEE